MFGYFHSHTYDSEPDESGNTECFECSDVIPFSELFEDEDDA